MDVVYTNANKRRWCLSAFIGVMLVVTHGHVCLRAYRVAISTYGGAIRQGSRPLSTRPRMQLAYVCTASTDVTVVRRQLAQWLTWMRRFETLRVLRPKANGSRLPNNTYALQAYMDTPSRGVTRDARDSGLLSAVCYLPESIMIIKESHDSIAYCRCRYSFVKDFTISDSSSSFPVKKWSALSILMSFFGSDSHE